jgi:hypothetical protein
MTIIEKIKEECKDEYSFPYDMEVKNWPDIDYEGEQEPLDMENWQVMEINDNYMTMQCGGDWQDPHQIMIELNSNNELEVVSCNPCDYASNGSINIDKLLGFDDED